jgi:hypothetical protein
MSELEGATVSVEKKPRKPNLVIVWNRDKPRYDLTVHGFRVTRGSEAECLTIAVDALERALTKTREQLETIWRKEVQR